MTRAILSSLLVCLLFVPCSASAQSVDQSSLELSAGYSYLRDPGNSIIEITSGDDSYRLGWSAGVSRRLWRAISAVGEISGHYKTKTTLEEDVRLSFHAFLGGPRAAVGIGPFEQFAQILAGAVHASGTAFGETVTTTDFSLQPGGGLDYPRSGRFRGRVQLDYRWIKGSGMRGAANQFRVVAAIVYR